MGDTGMFMLGGEDGKGGKPEEGGVGKPKGEVAPDDGGEPICFIICSIAIFWGQSKLVNVRT